jgi:hypothetical protein
MTATVVPRLGGDAFVSGPHTRRWWIALAAIEEPTLDVR